MVVIRRELPRTSVVGQVGILPHRRVEGPPFRVRPRPTPALLQCALRLPSSKWAVAVELSHSPTPCGPWLLLLDLYPDRQSLRREVQAASVQDETIRDVIRAGRWGRVWCPHTATAVFLREQIGTEHWIIVATAHPAKFETIVEPLIGRPVELPPSLAELLARPTRVMRTEPNFDEVAALLS